MILGCWHEPENMIPPRSMMDIQLFHVQSCSSDQHQTQKVGESEHLDHSSRAKQTKTNSTNLPVIHWSNLIPATLSSHREYEVLDQHPQPRNDHLPPQVRAMDRHIPNQSHSLKFQTPPDKRIVHPSNPKLQISSTLMMTTTLLSPEPSNL